MVRPGRRCLAEVCRRYPEKKTIRHGWAVNGRLVQWHVDLVRWWNDDRATLKKKPPDERERFELEAELAALRQAWPTGVKNYRHSGGRN